MEIFWIQGIGSRVTREDLSDASSWISGGEFHVSLEYGTGDWFKFNYISEEKEIWDVIWVMLRHLLGEIGLELETWNMGWTSTGSCGNKRRIFQEEQWTWAKAQRLGDAESCSRHNQCPRALCSQTRLREKQTDPTWNGLVRTEPTALGSLHSSLYVGGSYLCIVLGIWIFVASFLLGLLEQAGFLPLANNSRGSLGFRNGVPMVAKCNAVSPGYD